MQPYAAQQSTDPATGLPVTYYIYPPRPAARPDPTPVYTVHPTPAPKVKKTRIIREEVAPEPAGFTCGDDCANLECGPSRIWCNLLNPFAMCAAICPRPRTRDGENPMDVQCTFRNACPCIADCLDWICCYNCEERRPVRRVHQHVPEPRAVMVEAPQVHTVCVECGEVLDIHTAGGCSHPSHHAPYSSGGGFSGGGYETVRGVPGRSRGGRYRDVPPFPNGERSRYH
eukprot:GHVN01026695.1.p1 GENE.GHVN01026695.1~~GHVN01026695.1.p1  ORF type:complete len:228 (-),score=9.79 GHVN01026695.1:394-1077(-)